MARMVALAGSVAAAEALIGAIAASPAAAAIVPADDKRLTTRTHDARSGGYKAYVAEPRTRSLKPTVLVIHENRGLNDHIRDVARRLALAGFRAVAPISCRRRAARRPTRMRPATRSASSTSPSRSRTRSRCSASCRNRAAAARSARSASAGAAASSNRLAVAAGDKLDAGVVYYGPAPDPSEAAKVEAPLLIHSPGSTSASPRPPARGSRRSARPARP